MSAGDFEQLGRFYLGRVVGAGGETTAEPLLYDSKDLVTHAVCVGMTGSGKTGLCTSLLEEAAIDGVPAIAIDPKGDLGNLLLSFPGLTAEEFRPWIDAAEAARAGQSVEAHAEQVAARWRSGLAEWGQDGARIARLRAAADLSLYTPGSSAGRPLAVLRSLAAPPAALREDADLLRERVGGTVSGLLALLGLDADPLRSREHILASQILHAAWLAGRDLDLAALIREIPKPAFDRVGAFDLETFFPSADRLAFALRLNHLLASPGFAPWTEGEPLDVARLFSTSEGRPRVSVISIAHLSDAERMFVVTLLLNEVVAWMRAQAGTQSLRAILYLDEAMGFLPPVANPPSKPPLLVLLKQARAFGLGTVLATQNPVDLDYKALSNAGTWFVGRLQTARDQERVLDGLAGAAEAAGRSFDRAAAARQLAGLGPRTFLLHDVHEDAPVLFRTRFALSYLRGPLTRDEIRRLVAARDVATGTGPEVAAKPPPVATAATAPPASGERPLIPAEVEQRFAVPAAPPREGATLAYRAALVGVVTARYASAALGADAFRTLGFRAPLAADEAGSPWAQGERVDPATLALEEKPREGARWAEVPAAALRAASWKRWRELLAQHAFEAAALTLHRSARPKLVSRIDEEAGAFRVRLREKLHELRDLEVETLRRRFAPQLARLAERIRAAEARLARETEQYEAQKVATGISLGATVLGALFGRKLASAGNVGRAATAARGVSRAARERGDVTRAEEDLGALRAQLAALEAEFAAAAAALREAVPAESLPLEEVALRPRKGDLAVERLFLLWEPHWT